MKVLIACEHSGVLRDAFAARGHDAWSCDLLPSMRPGNHIQCDARLVLADGWDMMIAHPPCDYLTYAGIRHWNVPGRDELRETAFAFFMEMVNAPIPRICVENPRGYPNVAYRKPNQEIHPWMFGDGQMKRTALWLKKLPQLFYWDKPGAFFAVTGVQPEPDAYYSETSKQPGKARYFVDTHKDPMERSRTFPGVAAAMAAQWDFES